MTDQTPGTGVNGFVRSRLASFSYALQGLAFVLQSQHNAWIHLSATAAAVGGGLIVGLSVNEWLWIVSAIALVWFAEAINTSFEILFDVAQPERSVRIKIAKDVAAGAVLICSLYAVVVALLVFVPYLRS